MIVLETSALLAIVMNEPEASRCTSAISADPDRKVSAGTMTEAMIVADGRQVGLPMRALFERLKPEVMPVTAVRAEIAANAYRQWGKGNHPAGLNFGDCFAYALAKELRCPLLFVGNDFARTDVMKA